jgi:hypothetical protein
MTALARRLQARGNEVVFFGVPDVEPFARAAGLDFVPYGETEYPFGSIEKVYGSVAKLHGFEVVRHVCMDLNPGLARVVFEYLPGKLATTGIEALVIDTVHFFIELVPLSMSIPYVHVWNVLHLDISIGRILLRPFPNWLSVKLCRPGNLRWSVSRDSNRLRPAGDCRQNRTSWHRRISGSG